MRPLTSPLALTSQPSRSPWHPWRRSRRHGWWPGGLGVHGPHGHRRPAACGPDLGSGAHGTDPAYHRPGRVQVGERFGGPGHRANMPARSLLASAWPHRHHRRVRAGRRVLRSAHRRGRRHRVPHRQHGRGRVTRRRDAGACRQRPDAYLRRQHRRVHRGLRIAAVAQLGASTTRATAAPSGRPPTGGAGPIT